MRNAAVTRTRFYFWSFGQSFPVEGGECGSRGFLALVTLGFLVHQSPAERVCNTRVASWVPRSGEGRGRGAARRHRDTCRRLKVPVGGGGPGEGGVERAPRGALYVHFVPWSMRRGGGALRPILSHAGHQDEQQHLELRAPAVLGRAPCREACRSRPGARLVPSHRHPRAVRSESERDPRARGSAARCPWCIQGAAAGGPHAGSRRDATV